MYIVLRRHRRRVPGADVRVERRRTGKRLRADHTRSTPKPSVATAASGLRLRAPLCAMAYIVQVRHRRDVPATDVRVECRRIAKRLQAENKQS